MVCVKNLTTLVKAATDIFIYTLTNIWDVIESPLFILGIVLCVMLFEPWSMKFVYIGIWIITFYFTSKFIRKLENCRKKNIY